MPTLHNHNATITYVDTSTDSELYSYTVQSTNNMTWCNQEDFNIIELMLEASFYPNITFGTVPDYPNYVSDVIFGIVQGQVQFSHKSLSSGTTSSVLQCANVSNLKPVEELSCYIKVENTMKLLSGDVYTLTFTVTSGGNLELKKIDDGVVTGNMFYSGQYVQDVLEFGFDFDVPVHCTQFSSCTEKPLKLESDITAETFRAYWSGWSDSLSQVYRYSFEIWKLEYVPAKDGLQEPLITNNTNPKPLFISQMMSGSSTFPEFTPPEPGVYSCILEINDKANNSEYVRRIVIYDDTSDITVNVSTRLVVLSAVPETNFVWQTNLNPSSRTEVSAAWEGLFVNTLHNQEHFLARILPYQPRLSDSIRRNNYKRILAEFDDNEGSRTIQAIPNINGIVNYELNYEIVSGQIFEIPENGWISISPLAERSMIKMAAGTVGDGDSLQIWIRAFDVFGRNKTESTLIHFDQSNPENFLTISEYNVNDGEFEFTSKFTFVSQDLHSGVLNVSVQILLNETNEIKYQEDINVDKKTTTQCSMNPDCYCVPMGLCFIRTIVLEINNCLLGVPMEFLEKGSYNLHITSYNTATLTKTTVLQIGKVKSFSGINTYPSPASVTVLNKTNMEVTIQWTDTPTCYEKIGYTIILLNQSNDVHEIVQLNKNVRIFTFENLEPGSTYGVEMYTDYAQETNSVKSLIPLKFTLNTESFCSHLDPCFPGHCKAYIDECQCSNGFSGDTCLQFDSTYTPVLHQSNASASYKDFTSNKKLYSYSVSSENTIVTWSNQRDFNLFEFSLFSTFDANATFGSVPEFPSYIKTATFGIVQGHTEFTYKSTLSGENTTIFTCEDASYDDPVAELRCYIQVDNSVTFLSGDIVSLTFTVMSGGMRDLINIGDGLTAGREFYIGHSVHNILEFKFDFDVPFHCSQTSSCTDSPMRLEKDVSKTAVRPYWSGWSDSLSGVYRYSFEIWRLEYIAEENGLREPPITNSSNPEPLFTVEMMASNLAFPQYLPKAPGVYSCILEINDKANNSEYVRRIVVYDPVSDVTVNSSHRLIVKSATEETDYLWQTQYYPDEITNIHIEWNDRFANIFHISEHFLSKVLEYQSRLSDNIKRHNYKHILSEFDDNEGDRTISAITNIHGIVRFELVHEIVTRQKTQAPVTGWILVLPMAQNTTFQKPADTIGDGDTLQLWIRAFDILNNSKTDTTIVHFDQSGPIVHLTDISYNVQGEYAFTSRFTVITQDLHSGSLNVSFKLVMENTGDVKYQKIVDIQNKTKIACNRDPDCYCVPMGKCFLRKVLFDVNNCELGVPIDMIEDGKLVIYITSYNTAVLQTSVDFEIAVKNFYGVNSYPSPSSASFINKTKTSVTIQWTNQPTCYERVGFIIYLHQPSNSTRYYEVDGNTTTFTFTGLSPGLSYSLELYTEYKNGTYVIRSTEPFNITFDTSDPDAESSGNNLILVIALSVVGFILLLVIFIITLRYLLRRRHRNLCVGPISEPDVVNEAKRPIVQRSPSMKKIGGSVSSIRRLSGSVLSIPESPSLERANKKLETNIFDINLPKGRAKTLPPLPPLSTAQQ